MFYTLVNHQYKFIVFWNPKCGCTLLKNWFYRVTCPDRDLPSVPQRIHRLLKMNRHEFYVSKEEILEKYNDYFKFIVTRNPYERIVSYYCNKIINRQSDLVLDEKKRMTNKNCQLNFHQFCRFLLRMRKNYKLEHHAKPQFYGLGKIDFDLIIDLKDLNMMLPKIHTKLNIEKDIPYDEILESINRKGEKAGGNKTKYDSNFKKDVSNKKPNDFKKIPEFIHFYDDDSIKIIKDIYKNDFLNFGYSLKLGENSNKITKNCLDIESESESELELELKDFFDGKCGPQTVTIFKA